ncbi:fumarylacetoacetate hydrolase family protein [Pseudonocardia zijingensis]|uniref:Fumarylacetoacetase-like C-terminal domain-containing protein n=1 Tax=Pseudonocardia zijingensis TaxID=153376 RepID=A0ABN1N8F6_9PSEU
MRLASVRVDGAEIPAVVEPARGVARVPELLPGFTGDIRTLLVEDRLAELGKAVESAADGLFVPEPSVTFGAPYRHPRMIWGIGLNYVDHAADLSEQVPEEPASFIKGDHTVIGPGEEIPIPPQSNRTTAEAELGLVIGRTCRNVSEADALDYVAGVTTVLDQTAEDILERNPRFLTRSKNFPGFFSFGPQIVPLSEVGDLASVEVSTVLDGAVHRSNTVARMRYSPQFLVSFHSAVMPLYPGDIISTGTPGAVHIRPGTVAECRIPGVGVLTNPVVQG